MPDEQRPVTVGELSEQAVLARVFPLLPTARGTLLGPGDDAAVVAAPDGRFVVTTDVLVEDRHFRRAWSTGEDVGHRAAVQNLADVAAMGARPTSLVVSLVVPDDLPVTWVEGLARGLAAASTPVGAGVVGGDLSGGPLVVVAVTAHGDLEGRAPVTRAGARPGDVVALAGEPGRSAGGLAVLTAGRSSAALAEVGPAADEAVARYLRPRSPLAAGPAAALAGASAMLDVSDGLLRDAGRIAAASGVLLDLDEDALAPDVAALAPLAARLGADVRHWVLAGGEDHALLATFPPGTALPAPFRTVGRVRAVDGAGPRVLVGGGEADVAPGWDHFAG
ncbi:thiamine-phosphate kinase [Cellulomonas composti]|uniref:Thiamine-monophosphate kinase n=1 Tax=Cellulomonas composti TaxID=266130 RepID=A0A511JBN4_9CELL|nr:thiamine-phosphate kinase [Cellulomonas composti]GEL95113.1 thiamine-monophosphate kinase [Cellulomonas composti]